MEEKLWWGWRAHVFSPSLSKNNWLYQSIFLCTSTRMNSHSAPFFYQANPNMDMLLYPQQQVMMWIDSIAVNMRTWKWKYKQVRWTSSHSTYETGEDRKNI